MSPEKRSGKSVGATLRDAASLILVRDTGAGPAVLMGRRGDKAAFMPRKHVFPGGAVDPGDALMPLFSPPDALTVQRLGEASESAAATAFAAAAIRELWEEAGLILGGPAPRTAGFVAGAGVLMGKGVTIGGTAPPMAAPPDFPPDWRGFAATGHWPDASALRFLFRAVTPPGRSRRFDARFFLAHAKNLSGDPDDFSRASDELSDLAWVPLAQAGKLDLPFITEVVLAEVAAHLASGAEHPASVPFFDHRGKASVFRRIG